MRSRLSSTWRGGPRLAVLAAVLAVCAGCAGCAPAVPEDRGAAGAGQPLLYVPNSGDGTITRLPAAPGQPALPPLRVGGSPTQVVPTAAGGALVLHGAGPNAGRLTFVTRAGDGWVTRPVPLEAGARVTLLAGDGGRLAVAAYSVSAATGQGAAGPCRLALVDLLDGSVRSAYTACGMQETALSLALDAGKGDQDGATAYLGLWRAPAVASAAHASGTGRVLALGALSGRPRAVRQLAGAPRELVVSPSARGPGAGRRVYCVEAVPGPENAQLDQSDPAYTADDRWRLVALAASTLDPEGVSPLPPALAWLALAPSGDDGFALQNGALVRIDLLTGSISRVAALPGVGRGVAVIEDRVFVADPRGNAIWAVDRRGGATSSVRVGRSPVGVIAH